MSVSVVGWYGRLARLGWAVSRLSGTEIATECGSQYLGCLTVPVEGVMDALRLGLKRNSV